MTTTIYVEYGTPRETQAALETALAEQALRNPNWNGVNFRIDYAEAVWIDTDDVVDGAVLLHNVIYPVLAAANQRERDVRKHQGRTVPYDNGSWGWSTDFGEDYGYESEADAWAAMSAAVKDYWS